MNVAISSLRQQRPAILVGVALLLGAWWMVSIGGGREAGRVLPWVASLIAMSVVWIASLRLKAVSLGVFVTVAVALRLLFLFMPPGPDLYRYLWEGHVLGAGFSPYLHPPDDPVLQSLRPGYWTLVEHRGVSAIYPPLAQWFFTLLGCTGGGAFVCKAVFAGVDLLVCARLLREFGPRHAVVYAWNPLAAYSFAGGGHYDILFIAACVLGWLDWRANSTGTWRSTLWIGVAIAFKWMALPMALWILIHECKKRGFGRSLARAVLIAAPFLIAWTSIGLWTHEWSTRLAPTDFARVARSSEWIPAIVRTFTGQLLWDNAWFLGVMAIAWGFIAWRASSLSSAAELGFHATYLFSPLIHGWYFVWALPFAVGNRNRASIALAASGTAYFYVHHTQNLTGQWDFPWWQRAVIWAPFTLFLILDHRKHLLAAIRRRFELVTPSKLLPPGHDAEGHGNE